MTDPRDSYRHDSGRLAARLKEMRPYGLREQFLDALQKVAYNLGYRGKEVTDEKMHKPEV